MAGKCTVRQWQNMAASLHIQVLKKLNFHRETTVYFCFVFWLICHFKVIWIHKILLMIQNLHILFTMLFQTSTWPHNTLICLNGLQINTIRKNKYTSNETQQWNNTQIDGLNSCSLPLWSNEKIHKAVTTKRWPSNTNPTSCISSKCNSHLLKTSNQKPPPKNPTIVD